MVQSYAIQLFFQLSGNELTGCVAKQFLEYKTRGFIHCKFPQDFNSVYWYDVDNSDAKPILTYDRTTKTGEGFIRGEYDIQSNGTLIIRNVSMSHEKVFKVICFRPRELFNTYQIEVIVTGKYMVTFYLLCSFFSTIIFLFL